MRRRKIVWSLLGLALLVIALERQLGLLNLLTDTMRTKAASNGEYAARGVLQTATLKLVGVGAVAIGVLLAFVAGRADRVAPVLVLTTTGIAAYLVGKAVSLHAVDHVVFRRVAGVAVGNWIELGLVALSVGALMLAYIMLHREKHCPGRRANQEHR